MFKIFLAILLTISPILGYAQTAVKFVEANNSTGLAVGPNYVKNPNAETGLNNVTASGATLARVCSSPEILDNGTCSFDITSGTAGNFVRWSTETLNAAVKGTNCIARFKYQYDNLGTAADAWYGVIENGAGDEISPRAALTATMNTVAAANDGTSRWGEIAYTCNPSQENRFSLKHTTSNSARVIVDYVSVSDYDPNQVSMKISTQEQTYTPTYTGFGTVSTSNMKWYQDGAYLYVYGSFVAGTGTGVEARMSLPTGYVSSSTITTLMMCGDLGQNANSTTYFRNATLCEPNVAYTTFGIQNSTTAVVNKALGNTFGVGAVIQVNAKIPISGASNIQATTSACLQDGSCVNNFSAKVSSAGVVSDESLDFIQGNCSAATPYTCTFVTSKFSVTPNCTVSLMDGSSGSAKVNSAATSNVVIVTYDSLFTGSSRGFNISCSRAGTDNKPVMQAPWVSGSVTSNATAPTRHEWARVTGGNPPTIGNMSNSAWLVYSSRTGAGDYTFTHNFGSQVECSISAVISASRRFVRFQTLNTTTIRVTIEDSAGTGQDTDFSLICDGFRP